MSGQITAKAVSSSVVPGSGRRHVLLWKLLAGAVIVAASWMVYWPSIHGQFLLDDDVLVTENPLVHATNGLYRIWFTIEAKDYWPVTNSAFWAEWRLWGKETTGYRVVNLLFHIANALLVWVVLRKLSIPGAWLAGLLFAVHPVNVEAVAWIAQLKTVLSATFFLISIWCYLQFDTRTALRRHGDAVSETTESKVWYAFSLIAFLIGLLSKGSVATLPVLLLIILWWCRGKITRRDIGRIAPFFLVAIVLAAVNIWFQSHGKALDIRQANLGQRILAAGAVAWFYLYKALVPLNLSFVYTQWQVQTANWRWWIPTVATLLGTAALWYGRNSKRWPWIRPVFFAWLFYWVALGPVLGLVDVAYMRFTLVADHYQYLAMPAVLAVFAAVVWTLAIRLQWPMQTVVQVGIGLVAIALAFLAFKQSALYDNPFTLYTDTVHKNPDCWFAYNNMGAALLAKGRAQEAIDELDKALKLEPGYAGARFNLGVALGLVGRPREAAEQFRLNLKQYPDNEKAHVGLAIALEQIGERRAAIEELRIALQLKPSDAPIHNKLGIKLSEEGQLQEAIEEIRKATKLDPNNASYKDNLKELLNRSGAQ